MKKYLFLIFVLQFCVSHSQESPKIVVGIVIDQMRQDYLYRYHSKFSDDGFKRLINKGFQFKNAHYNYVPTVTAPGHSSIYTGTTPSVHGIVGNDWYSRELKKSIYCAWDSTVTGLGGKSDYGQRSPRNLMSSTITDELRLSSNFRSKVVSISLKDRGAIFSAGHNPNGAYWFDGSSGDFITSTYYMQKLPYWVENFNKRKLPTKFSNEIWNTLYDIASYTESSSDDVIYEVPFKGKEKATFPYDMHTLVNTNGIQVITRTPYGNTLVTEMAIAAMEGEQLGQDKFTDFLAISYSSTDILGHDFGPMSVEVEDMYLRLDLELNRLLKYLDKHFGDQYLIFLTSDHAVLHVPQFLIDNKLIGGYFSSSKAKNVTGSLVEKYGEGNWIAGLENNQIYLNHSLLEQNDINPDEIQNHLREELLKIPEIFDAYTGTRLAQRNSTSKMGKLYENGFHQKRSGDVSIQLNPGFLSAKAPAGTSHGSGYSYDTHVPLLFYGMNIPKGRSVRPVSVTDIASTLSMLLNISLPSGNTGEPLLELFE